MLLKPKSISVQTAPDGVKELHTVLLKAQITLEMAIAIGGCGRPAGHLELRVMSTTAASAMGIAALSTTVRSPFAPLCG